MNKLFWQYSPPIVETQRNGKKKTLQVSAGFQANLQPQNLNSQVLDFKLKCLGLQNLGFRGVFELSRGAGCGLLKGSLEKEGSCFKKFRDLTILPKAQSNHSGLGLLDVVTENPRKSPLMGMSTFLKVMVLFFTVFFSASQVHLSNFSRKLSPSLLFKKTWSLP